MSDFVESLTTSETYKAIDTMMKGGGGLLNAVKFLVPGAQNPLFRGGNLLEAIARDLNKPTTLQLIGGYANTLLSGVEMKGAKTIHSLLTDKNAIKVGGGQSLFSNALAVLAKNHDNVISFLKGGAPEKVIKQLSEENKMKLAVILGVKKGGLLSTSDFAKIVSDNVYRMMNAKNNAAQSGGDAIANVGNAYDQLYKSSAFEEYSIKNMKGGKSKKSTKVTKKPSKKGGADPSPPLDYEWPAKDSIWFKPDNMLMKVDKIQETPEMMRVDMLDDVIRMPRGNGTDATVAFGDQNTVGLEGTASKLRMSFGGADKRKRKPSAKKSPKNM